MTAGRPELTGCLGGVSSTHWLASGAGMAVLERGGNAFDAAVAAGFVLQVVEPHSNGLGGEVVIGIYSRATGTVRVICGQGPMPRAATIEAFAGLGLSQVPAAGVLPACVPGAFGGWLRLLAEFGTMRLESVLDPAISYASNGYPLLPAATRTIESLAPLFRAEWLESARTYLPAGVPPLAGSRMRNPALAATYQRILREVSAASDGREAQIDAAHNAFYGGFVAETVDDFLRTTDVFDSTGYHHRGLLRADDLAAWEPEVEEPARLTYGDLAVCKPGPWSQGPVFLQQLAILAGFDLRAMEQGSAEYVHTMAEAAKLAYADREAWYGDPRHTQVPMAELLAPAYTQRRRALVGERSAMDPRPGRPDDSEPRMPSAEPAPSADGVPDWMLQLRSGVPTVGVPAGAGAGNTCAVAAVDGTGNLAVAVPSGGWLKSSPVIPGLGFSLGTRGQTMWLAGGHPNSLAPGQRPRTTLSPSIVLRGGEPYLALATPGGDQQDQWTLQTLLAVAEFGLDLQAATELPAFHIDHFPQSFAPRTARPGVLVAERSVGPAVLARLRDRGHRIDEVPAGTLGKVCVAGVDPTNGFVRAAAGPRGRQAYAFAR